MRSRVIEARLRRLASASKPAGADDEAAAPQALHDKLDAMAARLHEDDQTDWGDVHLHVLAFDLARGADRNWWEQVTSRLV